jgi:hypothetical protein
VTGSVLFADGAEAAVEPAFEEQPVMSSAAAAAMATNVAAEELFFDKLISFDRGWKDMLKRNTSFCHLSKHFAELYEEESRSNLLPDRFLPAKSFFDIPPKMVLAHGESALLV